MFEFFIALFGGLFWGGKLSNEKSAAKKADQDHQHRMDTYAHHIMNTGLSTKKPRLILVNMFGFQRYCQAGLQFIHKYNLVNQFCNPTKPSRNILQQHHYLLQHRHLCALISDLQKQALNCGYRQHNTACNT